MQAILLAWLIKLLPIVLGLLGKMFVDWLTNINEQQGGASDPKEGAKVAEQVANLADAIVAAIEELAIEDGTEKRNMAVDRLKAEALELGITLATAAANTAVELAVQRLRATTA